MDFFQSIREPGRAGPPQSITLPLASGHSSLLLPATGQAKGARSSPKAGPGSAGSGGRDCAAAIFSGAKFLPPSPSLYSSPAPGTAEGRSAYRG